MKNTFRIVFAVAALTALMLVGCASAPNNDAARAKAHAAYDNADQEFAAEESTK